MTLDTIVAICDAYQDGATCTEIASLANLPWEEVAGLLQRCNAIDYTDISEYLRKGLTLREIAENKGCSVTQLRKKMRS